MKGGMVRRTLVVLVTLTAVSVGCTPPGGQIPPAIVMKTLAYGMVDQPYTETLEAIGPGPVTWTLHSGSLPDGLTLSPSGVISGTPTLFSQTQNFQPFSVQATNSYGSNVASFTIDVFRVGAVATVTPGSTGASLPEGAAIAMVSTPADIWLQPTMFQYLANGQVKEVGLLGPPFFGAFGPGPTKPQPTSEGGITSNSRSWSFSRTASVMTSSNGTTVDLWVGNPLVKSLVHTYTPPVSPYEYAQARISPDGTIVAIAVAHYPNTAATVYFYSTSAPFQQLRPPVTLPKQVSEFVWNGSSDVFGVNIGMTFEPPPGQEAEIALLSPTDPQADLAPPAYQDCRLTGFLPNGRLAAICAVSLFFDLVSPYIVTGSLDGSSVRTVLDWTGPHKCWASAGSPSGQYLALLCLSLPNGLNRLAYVPDEPINPASPPVPVMLTAPGPGSPAGQAPLEWSDDPWPYVP